MKDEVEEDNMEEDKDEEEVGTCRSPCHCPGR